MFSGGGVGVNCFNPIIYAVLLTVEITVSLGKVDIQI